MTSRHLFRSRIRSVSLTLLGALAGCEGGGPPLGPSVDSNSNWLVGPDTQADCPGGIGGPDTAFCLQPEAFEASPDEQRCIDACTESVNDHVLQLCLANGEPDTLCADRANEHVATCRFDCAMSHRGDQVANAAGPQQGQLAPPRTDEDAPPSDCGQACTDAACSGDSCDPAAVVPAPGACEGWQPTAFDRADEFIDTTYRSADEMNCDGLSFRRFDARYGLWVGVVSCGTSYRFFLSETADGLYLPAADYGGHGQDLCELLDPDFSIPHEDIITSGGCTECAIGFNYSFVAGEVFARGAFGQPFIRAEAPEWGHYQSSVITCATGPLECSLPSLQTDCAADPLGCR